MNDAAVHDLARRAGIAVDWNDYAGQPHRVSVEALRRILAALGLACDTSEELSQSRDVLATPRLPPLITATVGEVVDLPIAPADLRQARLIYEDGTIADLAVSRAAAGARLPAIHVPGYHVVEIGEARLTLAVAPARCHTVSDLAPDARIWGLAAQVYGLRSAGDCGIGDMAGIAALAKAAASMRADVLALSPTHALFAATPDQFSPYSPSTRLFYNPLHADARSLFGEARIANAVRNAGVESLLGELERRSLIDWPQSARIKMSVFRCLFDDFTSSDLVASPMTALAADFVEFRSAAGQFLEDHALFESLYAARLQAGQAAGNWLQRPAEWRNPRSSEVRNFAEHHAREILFHCFLQWVADRSFAAAQREAKQSGMRLGLLADLAVGMNSGGSHAWTSQDDILVGLEIGAPPDLFNTEGQTWGLTTFSPRALVSRGYAPFIATMRACMRHAGGVRIDHAMGLMRLWVVPHGAPAREGAYLAYPIDDLLPLIALESHRHQAIVIGEDLGTVPAGFQARLAAAGIYGMRVLWFEREQQRFAPPYAWSEDAAAMTSTHDLPTVAGWWRGRDIEVRAQCGTIKDVDKEKADRVEDREALWESFRAADVDRGPLPSADEAPRIVDAAVKFIAATPARLALLPLEDALALDDQPNLPGTIDEHPNWRRRYNGEAGELLNRPEVRNRLQALSLRGER